MPQPPWANPPQLNFLYSNQGNFATAQDEKTLTAFWVKVYGEFFAQWPDAATEALAAVDGLAVKVDSAGKKKRSRAKKRVAAETELPQDQWIQKRKDNIYYWFYNNPLEGRKKTQPARPKTVKLSLQPSTPRIPSEEQIYSKKYFDSRVKPLVDQEIKEQVLDDVGLIALRAKITAKVYSAETEEVKQEIRHEKEELVKARKAMLSALKGMVDSTDEFTNHDYMRMQLLLPEIVKDFCDIMRERTKWCMSFIAGGPDPAMGGKIRTIAYHAGENIHKQNFEEAYGDHQKAIYAPYGTYLQTVYSAATRDTFKLDYVRVKKSEEENDEGEGEGTQGGETTPVVQKQDVAPANHLSPTQPPGAKIPGTLPPPVEQPGALKPIREETPSRGQAIPSTLPAVNHLRASPPDAGATVPFIAEQAGGNSETDLATHPIPTPIAGLESTHPSGTHPISTPIAGLESTHPSGTHPVSTPIAGLESTHPSGAGQLMNAIGDSNQFMNPPTNDELLRQLALEMDKFVSDDTNFNTAGQCYPCPPFNGASCDQSYQAYEQGYQQMPAAHNGSMPYNHAGTDGVDPYAMEVSTGGYGVGNNQQSVNTGWMQHTYYNNGNAASDYNATNISNQAGSPQLMLPPIQPQASPSQNPTVPATGDQAEQPAVKTKRGQLPKVVQDENVDPNQTQNLSGPRVRKPASSKEVITLAEKSAAAPSTEWLTKAADYLRDGKDDGAWAACVDSWFKFEQSFSGDSSSHRLPVKMRPAALTQWLKTREYPPPSVGDGAAFAVEWIRWWNSIQPAWRRVAEENSLPLSVATAKQGDTLTALKKAGPSGLVTVLVSLKWWRVVDGDDNRWFDAVKDVQSCLEQLLTSSKKRKTAADATGSKKKAKVA